MNGRDRALKKVALAPIQAIPKSTTTRERLRNILRLAPISDYLITS